MTLRVPYISDDAIERDAEALLSQYAHAKGVKIIAPIPIEDVVEKHLKLRVEFDDLHRLFDVPRSGLVDDTDIFGALWLDSGRIVIDQSLDPEERPAMEGRFRFTLAHEGGHWRLHGGLLRSDRNQEPLFKDIPKPTVICRSSQRKERVEWQADYYASCILKMPRRLVHAEWQNRLGRSTPLLLSDLNPNEKVIRRAWTLMDQRGRGEMEAVDDALLESVAEPFARRFGVSRPAMRIRLEKLGLLLRTEPKQQSLKGML